MFVDYWRDLRAAFGPGPLITVGSGVIYPDGNRIEHLGALYEATEVEGELRGDELETLELGYFAVEGLPHMQPLSRLLLERALEVLSV